jgi:hypothetical protein
MSNDANSRLEAAVTELPPDSASITDHDRAYAAIYLRLLDAAAAGVTWNDAAAQILSLDVATDPHVARSIYDAYLARAQWMTSAGYRSLRKPT